jgi:hypothetical protein
MYDDLITVLQVFPDGWLYGRNQREEEGMLPGNLVENMLV